MIQKLYKNALQMEHEEPLYGQMWAFYMDFKSNAYGIFGQNQGSFISNMEWAPFKSLFWNANDSIAKLTISFASGVSL